MGDSFFKICGIAILAAMMIATVRKLGAEMSTLLKLVAGIVAAAACVASLTPVIEFIGEVSAFGGGRLGEYTLFLLKILGVAITVHICATVCRDCGEASLAGYIEIGGKVEVIILSLPYISEMIEVSVGLL